MINLPGSKGHHYLKSDPRHFKILVNKFYEACVYHDFSELKWILSPYRRTKIKKFIDMRDESILKEDSLYHYVFLLFNDFEAVKKQADKTFNYLLRQTAMLLGYKTEEFMKILKEKSIYEFLMEKVQKSKPMYRCMENTGHEEFYLNEILCKVPNLCNYCSEVHQLAKEKSQEIREGANIVEIDKDGTKTYWK